MSDCQLITLAQQLIKKQSITPNDAGCQQLLIQQLLSYGFVVEEMNVNQTHNFLAWHSGKKNGKTLLFAGHTDVVPPGPLELWCSPPFQAQIIDDSLYGRGAADMKGALAAMICAGIDFIKTQPEYSGRIGFLITSDEEGSARDGTVKVVEQLIARKEPIDYCIVGEPSCSKQLGDTIKNGRRGSLHARLTINGIQGHVAYPHLATNPIHHALPFLHELTNTQWDQGNAFFPATSMQITQVDSLDCSENMIPASLTIRLNFRYGVITAEQIQQRVNQLLDRYQLNYQIEWRLSGLPFLTQQGELIAAAVNAIRQITQLTPILSTSGGTSDGRFIAQTGCQIIELGVLNETIHKVNECVKLSDLHQLKQIYQLILSQLLCQ